MARAWGRKAPNFKIIMKKTKAKRNLKAKTNGKKPTAGKGPGGRPAMYQTPEEMQTKVDEYFETQVGIKVLKDKDGNIIYNVLTGEPIMEEVPPTQSDLALFLGFKDRQSLYDYAKRSEEFSCVIKKAGTRIDAYAERRLFTKPKPTGEIFYLKNRGWTAEEKRDIQVSAPTILDDIPA